jgi:hypothetical protein
MRGRTAMMKERRLAAPFAFGQLSGFVIHPSDCLPRAPMFNTR